MLVYLNGEWVPEEDARVSVFDRGFVFGDSVYEVIPVYGDKLFREDAHMRRLRESMEAVGMDPARLAVDWRTVFRRFTEMLAFADGSVYLQVTRGAAPRRHAFPTNAPLTLFAYARPQASDAQKGLSDGIAAVVLDDIRWGRCDIKTASLIANVLLVQEALKRGADEAVLVRDGCVTEGAVSNVFVVKDGVLLTAPRGHLILGGITRDVVLELATRLSMPICERAATRDELLAADEVLITSSSREVAAVTRLDGLPVGKGHPGPIFRQLYEAFQAFKADVRAGRGI